MKPKYRFLSDDELKHLEEEFKQFLIVNHVYAEEWVQLNQENPQKALDLVALFSNEVLQCVYEKIQFLEKRSPDACFVFAMGKTEMELRIIQLNENAQADLSDTEGIHAALSKHIDDLSFYKSRKPYQQEREQEIHQLIEQGALISSAEFWDMLLKIIP